jgi:hypothetical protein
LAEFQECPEVPDKRAEAYSVSRTTQAYGDWEMAIGRPRPALAGDIIGFNGLASDLSVFAEQHLPSGEGGPADQPR